MSGRISMGSDRNILKFMEAGRTLLGEPSFKSRMDMADRLIAFIILCISIQRRRLMELHAASLRMVRQNPKARTGMA
jgi:hypothetical protein